MPSRQSEGREGLGAVCVCGVSRVSKNWGSRNQGNGVRMGCEDTLLQKEESIFTPSDDTHKDT